MSTPSKEVPIWKQFERRVETESKMNQITCWRVPSEVRTIWKGGKPIPIHVKSLPDFCGGILGLAFFMDAKTTQKNNFAIQDTVLREDDSANKKHQWINLVDAHEKGNISGYLVWFVKYEKISWISVETINQFIEQKMNMILPDSPGVISFPDDQPINLKLFLKRDLDRRIRILGGS